MAAWMDDRYKLVAILEGGYDPPAHGRSVAATLRVLDGERLV